MDVPDEPKAPPVDPLLAVADRVVSRVAAVWVWTVLFAASASISFAQGLSLMQLLFGNFSRPGGGFGAGAPLGMVLIPICTGAAAIALAFSWWAQFRFFRGYILQCVIFNRNDDDKRRTLATRDLARGYFLLIVAALFKLMPDLLAAVLSFVHP